MRATAQAIDSSLAIDASGIDGFGADLALVIYGGEDPTVHTTSDKSGLRGLHPPFGFSDNLSWFPVPVIFAEAVRHLEGGVLLNIGTAVTGPEVFLKALSMSRNVALDENKEIRGFTTAVFDLVTLPDDWREGEPSKELPNGKPKHVLRVRCCHSKIKKDKRICNVNQEDRNSRGTK